MGKQTGKQVGRPGGLTYTPDNNPDDEFQGISERRYNESRFYVGGAAKASSSSIQVRIPDQVIAQMAKLIHSGEVPQYETYGHVIRDALVHRMHYVAEHVVADRETAAEVNRFVSWAMRESAYEAQINDLAHMEATVKRIGDLLEMAIEARNYPAVKRAWADAQVDMETMDYAYRDKVEAVIRKHQFTMEALKLEHEKRTHEEYRAAGGEE